MSYFPTIAIKPAVKLAKVALTTNQTGTTVYTPTSGKKVVVTGYSLSRTTDGNVIIFDGTDTTSTEIANWNMSGDGWGVESNKLYQSAAVDNIIKYTTDATATGVLVLYGYEI